MGESWGWKEYSKILELGKQFNMYSICLSNMRTWALDTNPLKIEMVAWAYNSLREMQTGRSLVLQAGQPQVPLRDPVSQNKMGTAWRKDTIDIWPLHRAYIHGPAYVYAQKEVGGRDRKRRSEIVQCRNLTLPRWRAEASGAENISKPAGLAVHCWSLAPGFPSTLPVQVALSLSKSNPAL